MLEILQFIFSGTKGGGFWRFAGCLIFFLSFGQTVVILWNRFWRHWNIRKHGYPQNTDADGDFKKYYNTNN